MRINRDAINFGKIIRTDKNESEISLFAMIFFSSLVNYKKTFFANFWYLRGLKRKWNPSEIMRDKPIKMIWFWFFPLEHEKSDLSLGKHPSKDCMRIL